MTIEEIKKNISKYNINRHTFNAVVINDFMFRSLNELKSLPELTDFIVFAQSYFDETDCKYIDAKLEKRLKEVFEFLTKIYHNYENNNTFLKVYNEIVPVMICVEKPSLLSKNATEQRKNFENYLINYYNTKRYSN